MFLVFNLTSVFFYLICCKYVLPEEIANLCDSEQTTKLNDHILFEYEIIGPNGLLVASVKKPKQLPHVIVQPKDYLYGLDLVGICSTFPKSFQIPAQTISSLSFLTNKSDILSFSGFVTFTITIHHVTSSDDYEIFEAMNGNTSRAIDMIQNHIGVNAVDEWGQTPIMIATIHKNLPLIAELMNTINPRVNLNIEKSSGFNVLFYAIHHCPVGILHAYLKRGANPNQQIQAEGSRGNTPLHNAVLLEKSDHVEVLLDAGADPDILNQYGLTPLEMLPSQALPSTKTYYKRLFEDARRNRQSEL